jgi:hypothetical protein
MYVFGGTINTAYNTLNQLFSGNFVNAFVEYYIKNALPPTSIEHVFGQAVLGAGIAAILWFVGMAAKNGISF